MAARVPSALPKMHPRSILSGEPDVRLKPSKGMGNGTVTRPVKPVSVLRYSKPTGPNQGVWDSAAWDLRLGFWDSLNSPS